MPIDFDNPSLIRTLLIREGRSGYRIEVRRGRDVLLATHPKLVKSFAKAFSIGEQLQIEANKHYEI
jgi:hypothetical protein